MNRIYAFLASILTIIVGFIAAFAAGGRSKANEIKAESEEAAREYIEAGYEAGRIGAENERRVRDEEADTSTDRFR